MSQLHEFGPFLLNTRSGSLYRDGREIHLTAKCFSTLVLLVERAGSLVSKSELLSSVWPSGYIEPANVTQTIYMLRKSLGDADGRLLATVPGRGYRFTATVRTTEEPSRNAAPKTAARRRLGFAALAALAAAALVVNWKYESGVVSPSKAATVVNPVAQRDYILGRHYWSERTVAGIGTGLHYFKAALAIDPTYAQAESGISDSYSALGYYLPKGPETKRYFETARATALHAVQLDPNSAEAHASLAFTDEFMGKSYASEVKTEFERSISLNGKYATAREWYSWYLYKHRDVRGAAAQMLQARNLDPLSPIINFALGYQLYYSHQYGIAAQQWHFVMSIVPHDVQSYYGAGLADEALGDKTRAEREFQRALQFTPNDPDVISALAHLDAETRNFQTAFRLLSRIASVKPAPAYDIALVNVALGQDQQALKWLTVAYAENDANLATLQIDPRMAKVCRLWLRRHEINA